MSLIKKTAGVILQSKVARIKAEIRATTPIVSGRLRSTTNVLPYKGQYGNGLAITLGRHGLVKRNNINSGTDVKTKRGKIGYEDLRVKTKHNLIEKFKRIIKKIL